MVPGLHEFVDRLFQVGYADEGATPDGFVRQFSEPALDQIEPARTGRNEVADEPGMLLQPSAHVRLFMRVSRKSICERRSVKRMNATALLYQGFCHGYPGIPPREIQSRIWHGDGAWSPNEGLCRRLAC